MLLPLIRTSQSSCCSRSVGRRLAAFISQHSKRELSSSANTTSSMSETTDDDDETSTIYWCQQVAFPHGIHEGSVQVRKGKIVACQPGQSQTDAEGVAKIKQANFRNLGETSCLSPGLVDVHVHISALGRDWEGYTSATKAAAAGGITTLVGMPLNSLPPTTSPENFALEQNAAQESTLYVDVGQWGGIIEENCNPTDLNALLSSGVLGLKAFLSPLPPEAGFQAISPEQLIEAAKICGDHDKPILVHAELVTEQELQETTEKAYQEHGTHSYLAHIKSRPTKWEQDAVEVVCEAASYCHMHIVHLSDASCLDIIRKTKANPDKRLTVETCSHYLLLDNSVIQDGATHLKCFPPIRDPNNREGLWKGLKNGLIDVVASDHSPCQPGMRCMDSFDMKEAWAGLSGLQYQLPATWTGAANRKFTPEDMAAWWSYKPCSLVSGMLNIKGSIEPGKQADFCWWDTEYVGAPNGYSQEYHRWKGTSFYATNSNLRGRVLGTWVRGVQVYDGENDRHLAAAGNYLLS